MEERRCLYECWSCSKRREFDTREDAYEGGFYFPETCVGVPVDIDRDEFVFVWAICSECFDKQAVE